jgi:hypothetical protein
MAVDKLVDSTQLDADLTSVANAIRTKGGTSASLAFPAGFVSAVQAIPSGGGGDETGSFIAGSSQSNITISVSSLHSHILIWDSVVKSDDDLTSAPYGRMKTVLEYADNNTGFVIYGAINSNGTGYTAQCNGIGRWGGNTYWNDRVEFSSSTIKIINPRISGGAYPLIDGHTYNWRAW